MLSNAFLPTIHNKTIENARRYHQKSIRLKTLSRVETFKNGAVSYCCGQGKWRLSKMLTSFALNAHVKMNVVMVYQRFRTFLFERGKRCENGNADGERFPIKHVI